MTRIGSAARPQGGGTQAPPPPTSRAPSIRLQPGQLLGHTYEIEARLAKGGMGEVYRARHVELGSLHAIKVILPELANDEHIIAMFTEEARKLRRVRDDAVVAYDGMFRDENGLRYLVMEFVDGVSLAQAMRERKFAPAELRRLRDRLAQGLAAAHDKLIYHRDMSPDNVILVDDRVELAKIIDFGIAKAAGAGEQTVVGSDFAGKYSYVSPEQLGMFGGEVDGRSDIYSLGLVLAAAALGQPLPMGNSPASAIEARRAVPDLSALPAELRDDLAPMLVPDPQGRPRSMRELVGSRSGGGQAASAPATPSRPADAAPIAASRSRVPILAAIALACAVIGGGGAYVFLAKEAPRPASVAAPRAEPQAAIAPAPAPPAAVMVAAEPPPAVAERPAPVEPPPPATLPAAAISPPTAIAATMPPPGDRNEIVARLSRATQGFACADLKTALSADLDLQVTGFISTEADQAKLRQALDGIPNLRHVDFAVPVYGWPHCDVIKLLQSSGALAAGAGAPRLDFNIPSLTYRAGDKLVVRAAQSSDFDGYLYVDYLDNAGSVVHLFPRPKLSANAKAGQTMTLGTDKPVPGKNEPAYEISEPFGPNLIVAIASPRRLMEARPDEVEDAKAYLPVLRSALEAQAKLSGGARAEGAYAFITTVPR